MHPDAVIDNPDIADQSVNSISIDAETLYWNDYSGGCVKSVNLSNLTNISTVVTQIGVDAIA